MSGGSYFIGFAVIAALAMQNADCTVETVVKFAGKNRTIEDIGARNSSNATALENDYKNAHCFHKAGYRTQNRTEELECCDYVKRRFYWRWYTGRAYLTTFLDTLKQWECPEFERQCRKRYFDFTPFTNIVYMRACQREKYRNHCLKVVTELVTPDSTNPAPIATNITEEKWANLVHGLNSKGMTDEDLKDPCTQVALYEGGRGGKGRFHESVDAMIPFCGFIWCGYDADTVYEREVSVWTCMPQRCRVGIGIATAIIGCLGLATLLANLTIVAVYWYKRRMNNSQSVYKVTLAIGDTLVGAIVFPTFISTFFLLYTTRQTMGDYVKPILNESLNGVALQPRRMPSGHIFQSFSRSYYDAVGFFTALSIFISVYTLMLASFDRMAAVCRPMAYDKRLAMDMAKYSCAILGLVGLVVATLPIYTNSLRYGLVASILISLSGNDALIFYTVVFLLPLILVWASTITLFVYSKKHSRVRRRISSVSSVQVSLSEKRLAKTLGIMVGVFTVTILPAAITLISSFFLSDIFYSRPEALNKTSATVYISLEFVSVVILTTNSLWNCFIYGSRDKDFRKTAKELFNTANNKLGASAVWRSMKSASRRRLTSSRTSLSSTGHVLQAKRSTCSELGKQGCKNPASQSSTSEESRNETYGNNNATKETGLDPGEDSTWRSFAIDPNAGNLYYSVMENIPDGLDEDDKREKKDNAPQ